MLDPNDLKTWNILIVDDEPDNLEVIAQSLHFFGATVKTARDGLLGLQVLESCETNFVLLDLSMPNMDGWQMRAKIKENPKTGHLPVIALTAHAMAGDKERAMEAGFDGYLTKPVNVPTLVQDVKKFLVDFLGKQKQGVKVEQTVPPVQIEAAKPSVEPEKETTESGAVTEPITPITPVIEELNKGFTA